MKIVHLTSVHSAFDSRIFYKECKTLVNAGYEVVIIAPYGHDEIVEGVQIRGVTQPLNRYGRVTRIAAEIYKVALQEDAKLYHFHDPELMSIGIALRLRGKKVIYDVHENLSQQVVAKSWLPDFLKGNFGRKVIAWVERVGAETLSGIIAATPEISSHFPSENTIVVQNFPIIKEFEQEDLLPYTQRPMKMAYVGKITEERGIFEILQAMELVAEYSDVSLLLGGAFSSIALENKVRNLPGWKYVEFQGWLDRIGVRSILGRSRVGLVMLHPTADYLQSYPVKLFEYMASGLPVIVSDFPLWHQILDELRCALFVNPSDPVALAEAIRWVFEHPEKAEEMGVRGRQAVLSTYNWSTEAMKLEDFYKGLIQ